MSSEAAVAAHDYRVAHATRKALKYTSELHKTLAVRSGVVGSSSVTNSSSAPSRPSPRSSRCLSSSEEEEMLSERGRGHRAKSPKKYPAPPPPPPPPSGGGGAGATVVPQDKVAENASTSNLLPKNVTVKGID